MKKFLAVLLVMVMAISVASCGQKITGVKTDLSKPVTISWIMPGPGLQADSEKVWTKFNEELKKVKGFENVNVNFEVIPYADYSQKVMLMQTSGEKMDIIQTYSLDFATEYRNGSFTDLTDYMYLAKKSLSEMPKWVADMGKVDGGQAIIPNYQKMVAAPEAITMPKDLAEKYADLEAMKESFQSADFYVADTYKPVEEYLSKVKAAGKLSSGVSAIPGVKNFERITSGYGYKTYEDDVNVVYLDMEEGGGIRWEILHDYYNKGYVRKDNLSVNSADYDGVKNGNVMWTAQIWTGFEVDEDISNKGVELIKVPVSNKYFVPYQPAAGGLAVSSQSEYPDVSMMLINLINSTEHKDLYNLLVYGFEGEHYEVVKELEDDKVIKPVDYVESPSASAKYGIPKWIVGNAKNAYLTSNLDENYKEFIFDYQNEGKDTEISKLMGFALSKDTIETKDGQIQAIIDEYVNVWNKGTIDYREKYDEYKERLKAAGIEEVLTEIQRQVDEFLATK